MYLAGTDSFTIVNAVIFDGHDVLDADTVVVQDGVLTDLRVGVNSDLLEGSEIIDAHGGLVTPGFVDAHVHPVFAGIETLSLDLSDCDTVDGALARIRRALITEPGSVDWLTGGGWSMSDFPGGAPHASLLDELCAETGTNRPIQLISADHHSSWVNSAALTRAGIDASTLDPSGGVIDRDADGEPTGTLHESAVDLVGALIPKETPEELRAGILEGQRRLHEVGVTGYIDAIVGDYLGHGDTYQAYIDAVEDGVLTCEVTASLWWRRDIDVPADEAARLKTMAVDGPQFRTTNVKFMLDGIVESLTAAVTEPYLEPSTAQGNCPCERMTGGGNHGTHYFTPEHLAASFRELRGAGFDIHCHAIGDAAVHGALDAFEASQGITLAAEDDERHHIAHLQVVDPADVPRMAALGVTANLQALWAHYDEQLIDLNLPVLGEKRSGWMYPFADFAAAGTQLAMGSDWPVSTPDPWQAIHVAVNRTHPTGARHEPLLPDQALDVMTCLRAYTTGSARLARTRTAGRLILGAPADLALASAAPVGPGAVSAERISEISNTLTVAAGRIVYVREDPQ
ncbi:amidohydrolase [Corynebacterium glyciniphilum]|uniref:amidohydrolase n=1 Tax=Corynebacterium glyciniphilum TaxID=1404244 RepID=UPI0021B28832|nr:amidohydrolase [Corynebacterium glyciniphilum]